MLTNFVGSTRREAVGDAVAPFTNPKGAYSRLARKRLDLTLELADVETQLQELSFRRGCGLEVDWQDVETYRDGSLGVSRQFVDDHQGAVGQVQWLDRFDEVLEFPPNHDGTVVGMRWATGGLIDAGDGDLFLTAGHVFVPTNLANVFPSRGGETLRPEEAALLMRVNFNFQLDGATNQVRADEPFPIVELVEFGLPDADYAIVRLGPDAQGRRAGDVFGRLRVASRDVVKQNTTLCIIQHPLGREKKIEAGPLVHNNGRRITYTDLDVANSSSGAPILSPAGTIVGVHVQGGCRRTGGVNRGVSIGLIRAESELL